MERIGGKQTEKQKKSLTPEAIPTLTLNYGQERCSLGGGVLTGKGRMGEAFSPLRNPERYKKSRETGTRRGHIVTRGVRAVPVKVPTANRSERRAKNRTGFHPPILKRSRDGRGKRPTNSISPKKKGGTRKLVRRRTRAQTDVGKPKGTRVANETKKKGKRRLPRQKRRKIDSQVVSLQAEATGSHIGSIDRRKKWNEKTRAHRGL